MECDLTTWTSLMLHCDIFLSYSNIVTKNETPNHAPTKVKPPTMPPHVREFPGDVGTT